MNISIQFNSILVKPICSKTAELHGEFTIKTLKIAHNNREIHRNIKMDLYHI